MPDPRDDVSRREIERQIADLKRDKIRLEENIRRMEVNQQRIFREEPTRNRTQGADDGDKPPEAGTRKRSRSGSAKGDDEGEEAEKKKENEEKDGEDGKEPERKRREKDKDGRPTKTDPRSRNLFGKLLGHLHSAKSRLESEKGSKAAELHQKAQVRIEEKLSLSKMNIKEFRKAQFDQQKKEEEAKVQVIDKTIEEKEMLLLQRRLESHYSLMMNFIRTKAEPTIFYLPAKQNKDSEHALEETRSAIKHKIASLKVQLQATLEGEEGEDALRASAAAAAVAAAEAKKPDSGAKAPPEAAAKEEGGEAAKEDEEAKEDEAEAKEDEAEAKEDDAKDEAEAKEDGKAEDGEEAKEGDDGEGKDGEGEGKEDET